MAAFDFERAIRWARTGRSGQLTRRPDAELPFLVDAAAGQGILLDTCVYIDQLQDRLPIAVDDMLKLRVAHHSTVCLQELMYSTGRLDPSDHRSAAAVKSIGAAVSQMQPRRLHEPDPDVAGRGALVGGILSRIQNYERGHTLRAVNDGILFLQAAKLGLTLLSRNIADFDYLLQMIPAGRVLFYRRIGEV